MEKMDNSREVSENLRQLCVQLLGNDCPPEELRMRLTHSFQLITNPIFTTENWDEGKLIDSIKKRLLKAGKQRSAIQFLSLCGSLGKKDLLKHRAAVLKFLLSLNQHGKLRDSPQVPLSIDSSQNGDLTSACSGASPGSSIIRQKRPPLSEGEGVRPFPSTRHHDKLTLVDDAVPSAVEERGGIHGSGDHLVSDAHANRSRVTARHAFSPDSQGTPDSILLRDLVFVLQGIDGQYLRYDTTTDSYSLTPAAILVDPKRELILRTSEIGWLHNRVKAYCDNPPGEGTDGKGLITQAFRVGLQDELCDFYKELVTLQSQLPVTSGVDGHGFSSTGAARMTARRLHVSLGGWKQRLLALAAMVEACTDCYGGALLSRLHSFIYHGDPTWQDIATKLLTGACRQLLTFVMKWIYDGTLDDESNEFFVAISKDVNQSGERVATIRKEMLPSFINESTAVKILFIGKSVKLMLDSSMKQALDDWESQLAAMRSLAEWFSMDSVKFSYDDLPSEFEKRVESVRRAAAEKLYSYCFEETNALKALNAWVKNAFLLGKGELFLAFVDTSNETNLAGHVPIEQMEEHALLLMRAWESAMDKIYWLEEEERQYFNNVAPYFDVDHAIGAKSVWDAIGLRLQPPQRLRPLFTTEFLTDLNIIFRFLLCWRRTQCLVESAWLILKKSPINRVRSLPNSGKVHQLVSLMHFVVKNFQYYVHADVLEIVYGRLMNEMTSSRDFEHVLKLLHVDLVDHISQHCFLKRDGWQKEMGELLASLREECDSFCALLLSRMKNTQPPMDQHSTIQMGNDNEFAKLVHQYYVNFQRKTGVLFVCLTKSKIHDNAAYLNHLLLRLNFNDFFSSTEMS